MFSFRNVFLLVLLLKCSSFFSPFFIFSFYILFLFHKNPCFCFYWIVSHLYCFFGLKNCVFLVCWSFFLERNVPWCFLFSSCFNLIKKKKTCRIIICFNIFSNSFFFSKKLWFFSIPFSTCFLLKLPSSPLYFLLLFTLFPSVLSCLSPLGFSFLSPFSPFFLTSFFFVFARQTMCKKKKYLLELLQNYLFCLLFSIKIFVFSASFFCWAFFRLIYFPCFVIFLCLEKWFLIFV